MADPKKKDSGIDLTGIEMDAPAGSVLVQSRSGMYKPEAARTLNAKNEEVFIPLRGILMTAELKKADSDKPFHVLVFQLTRPTYVENRDKKAVRLEIGDTALIPVTARLRPWLQVALRENPTELVELHIVPDTKEDIGAGKTLWEYQVSVVGKHLASKMFTIASLVNEAPVLTEGEGVSTSAPS
jgi:hypothetical protein